MDFVISSVPLLIWAFCCQNVGILFPSFISNRSFALHLSTFVMSLILISIYAAIDHLLCYVIKNKLYSVKQKNTFPFCLFVFAFSFFPVFVAVFGFLFKIYILYIFSRENGSYNKEPTTSIQPIQTTKMRTRRVLCVFFGWSRKLLHRRHHIQD